MRACPRFYWLAATLALYLTEPVCARAQWQGVANMKHFDLKPVLALLNTFTTSVRENVLDAFASMREQVRLLWVESWMDNEHGIILLCQCNISWTAGWWLSRETWTSVLCMCLARAPSQYMTA